jgi:hypothetical protein
MCGEALITEAQHKSGINIRTLIEDLSDRKRQEHPKSTGLTEIEKIYLCLSLSGYSKGTIAYRIRFHQLPTAPELQAWVEIKEGINYLRSEMAKSVNRYIKQILGLTQPNVKMPSWATTIDLLKDRHYGISPPKLIASSTKARLIIEGDLTSEQLTNALRNLGINVTVIEVIES